MDRRFEDALDRFLAADLAGREEGAEEALFALFAGLPVDEPPPGFAARVLERAVIGTRAAAPAWLRLAVAACLVATGGLAVLLPWLLAPFVPELTLARAIDAASAALAAVAAWLTVALELWHELLGVASALRLPFETGATAGVAVLCLLVSAGALALLSNLIAQERNWSHVEPS